jgi:hypothetical protein
MEHDLVERRRRLERERSRFEEDPSGPRVPAQVLASWMRCRPTVDTAWSAAPGEDADDAVERWSASPIRRAMPELTQQLLAVAEDGDFLAGITDGEGRVLWSAGGRAMRVHGERINFMPGGFWDEPSSGTNAVAMSLITAEPTTMFSFEHWCPAFSEVVCYSAPVRDPAGQVLGVLDLTTTWDRTNPLGLPTVSSMARAVEAELARNPTLLSAGRGLELRVLGHPAASIDGVAWSATLRQLEILVTLATVGEAGLDELHALIYGDRMVSPTTTKAEISHLRRMLGGVIGSRPYRFTVPVRCDLLDALACIDRGDLDGAMALYEGQLLIASEAPLVVERRLHLDVALRTALLCNGSVEQLVDFAAIHPFDEAVLERAGNLVGPQDPLVPRITAALHGARR